MIRILFLPLFLYAGMATGYALAAFGTIDPALMCVASKSECGLVAAALFDSSALSIQFLSDAVWKVGISDLFVIFGVLALGASGLTRRKETHDFLFSLIVLFVAAWLFVMHPMFANSLFFILMLMAALGLLIEVLKKTDEDLQSGSKILNKQNPGEMEPDTAVQRIDSAR